MRAKSLQDDERWMRVALALGRRGLGQVWPNPSVGCVLVKEGRLLARGWTGQGGRPHGERVALAQAGGRAQGASLYVTLEPCAHHGKSAPCADALIEAGIGRVVYGLIDPDPRVSGRGIERLREAGIEVTGPILEALARETHAGFLMRLERGRPYVSLKLASTLDGKIATNAGQSKWITGQAARRKVQGLRACHDAILVGGGTARADEPRLNLRIKGAKRRQPLRIIATRLLELPQGGNLAQMAGDGLLYLAHSPRAKGRDKAAWQALGAHLIEVEEAQDKRGLALGALMQILGEKGLTRLLVEGGGQLGASLLKAGLVDRLIQFYAGKILGADAHPAIGDMGIEALEEAPSFRGVSLEFYGQDAMMVWSEPKERSLK